MLDESRLPVLIGAGQFTDRSNSANGYTPIEMIGHALSTAIQDTGKANVLTELDVLACSGLTVDAAQVKTPVSRLIRNVPQAVAKQTGIAAKRYVYAAPGGNTPQMLVNHFAKAITQGECDIVALAGGEALHTMNLRFGHWSKVFRPKGKWKNTDGPSADEIGDARPGNSEYEGRYAMNLPANVYPLFENALRAHYGRSIAEHQQKICELFADFSAKAAQNPYAWFQTPRSKSELLEQGVTNRTVAFPYRRKLNSMILVNQAAALVMTSAAKARALGIPEERWIYLHGYADAYDQWHVSERENFFSSPAINAAVHQALKMAKLGTDDIAAFDLYSCFPSAVQIACDELGISHADPRGLTLTGGLPYFGGPGNNYSMHAIAEAVNLTREDRNAYVFVNANGWYLTKHAVGLYSGARPSENLPVEAGLQPTPATPIKLDPEASGPATVETYTVLHNRQDQPTQSIIVARTPDGRRCLATTDNDAQTFRALTEREAIGRSGKLVQYRKQCRFELD